MEAAIKSSGFYHFDDVEVDCAGLRVEKNGQRRKITPRAFEVLVYLVEHRGRIVEKQELFEQVWKERFVTDNALTRIIKEIRRVIGDNADEPRYIETVLRHGYRFIADVKTVKEENPESEQAAAPVSQQVATAQSEPQPAATTHTEMAAADSLSKRAAVGLRRSGLLVAVVIAVGAIAIIASLLLKTQTAQSPTEIQGLLRTTKVTYSLGLDIYPSISPDGNSIAYSSDQSGGFEVYVKQVVSGGREIKLTSDGTQNLQPAWSPDGKLIAYYSKDRGGIWVLPALGGVPRQISEFGSHPAWSRDGSAIAFQSEPLSDLLGSAIATSTIWIVSSEGGYAKPITQVGNPPGGHNAPAWSPNGKRIVFVSYESDSDASLWTVSIEGNGLKQLIKSRVMNDPVYSPDGEYIYYRKPTEGAGMGLWKLRISPASEPVGEPVLVLDPGEGVFAFPSMSADGKKMAYSLLSVRSNLWAVPLSSGSSEATGSPVQITNDTSRRNQLPAFSPDGRKIAYTSSRPASSVSSANDVWLVDADGKNPQQLTTDPALDGLPSWLSQGDRVAFTSNRTGHWALWATTPAGGRETLLLDLGEGIDYMRLSPDGKQVALHLRKDGIVNIWMVALEGGQPVQLTFDKELMGWPCWSPDGEFLAFEMRRGDDTHIGIIPSKGGPVTQLTFEHGQSWPYGWSPDGDRVAFAGFRDGYWNVWWVSRTTKQQKQVTSYKKLNAFVRCPAWSPLGNQIVYEYNESTGNVWIMELK
jgi:Tol biopolymer transport system component/DNA-binding winged helix-turn-helix (wHTH) protein